MTDQDWKIITTLYSTSNITRTAEILHTTQPTISKRLQQMEEELGVRLVERNSKGVRFTPEGDYVAEEGRKLLQKISTLRESVLKISKGQTGRVRLGITNSMGRYILPPLLKLYKKKYPRVDFEISTGVSSEVEEMLEDHRTHVGFIRGEADPGIEKHLLSVSQAVLVSKNSINLKSLPSLTQIQYITDKYSLKLLNQWWNDQFETPPTTGLHVNHGDTCREMISNGLGYSIFLSPEFIDDNADLFKMPLFFRDGRPFVRNNWMIWNRDVYEIPLIRNFIDFIIEHFQPEKSGKTGTVN